ncbi:MAG: hypothetical protein HY698_03710 [Deltaproteobacteria bacterium]|nr:hypothetical protein [Deltaproteobacteria bacterium]
MPSREPPRDSVIPLSRFSPAASRPRGKKRLEAILSRQDPAGFVASMPVQDLYFLIKEVGIVDAVELLHLSTPEQVQGFLDLVGWAGDRLEPLALRPWLAGLLDSGPEHFASVVQGLDPELAALILHRWTRVYNLHEEEVPESEEPPFFPTPDRFFLVKITADHPDDVKMVERMLDSLYRADPVLARHLLRSAGTETEAYLEEMSFRFRSGRLGDIGFPALDEALEVYRPLDVSALSIGEGSAEPRREATGLPAVMAEQALKQGFLAKVLARVTWADEADRLEAALVSLFNHVLAADRVDPGEPEAVALGAARAAATLSLGLEAVARGDVDRGLEALRTISLVRFHRTGHSLGLQLSKLVQTLGPWADRAPLPKSEVLGALKGQRPLFSRVLDDPPAGGTRPLGSLEDIRRAADVLAEVAEQVRFVTEVLGVDSAKLPPTATVGDVARTALVHAALGHGLVASPLSPGQVLEFLQAGFQGGTFAPKVAERIEMLIPREFRARAHGFMDEILGDLGGLDRTKAPEKRHVSGLVLE